MVKAIERQVRDFEMPGTGIPDFADPRPGHRQGRHLRLRRSTTTRSSCRCVVRHWGLEGLEGLDDEAEAARQSALRYIRRVGIAAKRLARHREPALA